MPPQSIMVKSCLSLFYFFSYTSSRIYRKVVAEPRSDSCSSKLRLVLGMHQRTTVGKFASLVNPRGQTLWHLFLIYLEILWQQGEKKGQNQQTQQTVFTETLRFVFQCTGHDKPQKFWQEQKGSTINFHLSECSSF